MMYTSAMQFCCKAQFSLPKKKCDYSIYDLLFHVAVSNEDSTRFNNHSVRKKNLTTAPRPLILRPSLLEIRRDSYEVRRGLDFFSVADDGFSL